MKAKKVAIHQDGKRARKHGCGLYFAEGVHCVRPETVAKRAARRRARRGK